jgi:hypothetical protein
MSMPPWATLLRWAFILFIVALVAEYGGWLLAGVFALLMFTQHKVEALEEKVRRLERLSAAE